MAVAVGLLLLAAPPASAHSELERSDPPAGGMVAEGRTSLTLWFTESVNIGASTFDLRTVDGDPVEVAVAAADGGFVELETAPLTRALYHLDWAVLSADDGHPSRGSVLFGAGVRPAWGATADGGAPDLPVLLVRWVDLVALMLVIGALSVSGRVLGSLGSAGEASRRRARRVAVAGAVVAFAAGAVAPFVRTPHEGLGPGAWLTATWGTLTDTPWGRLWVVREILLVVATVALVSWARGRPGRWFGVRVAVGALLVAVALESWAGHASTLPSQAGVAAAAAAAHLVAAGVWAGGLAVLALCLVPTMRRDPDTRGPLLASVWRTYSPRAAVATVVLLATGIYESGRHLPELGSVAATLYGGAVAAKAALLAVALVLAGFNTLLVNPDLAARVGRWLGRPAGWSPIPLRRFTSVVLAEVAVLGLAVGVAALLTSVPTARDIQLTEQTSSPHSSSVDGVFVTFEEVPAGEDSSRLIVRASPLDKTEQSPISGVQVVLVGPDLDVTTVVLDEIEPGRFEAETPAPDPGQWSAEVAIQRAGLPDAVTEADWTAADASAGQTGGLELPASGLAAGLLVALLATLGVLRSRRRDGEPGSPTPQLQGTGSRS
jgi:copper transport protein